MDTRLFWIQENNAFLCDKIIQCLKFQSFSDSWAGRLTFLIVVTNRGKLYSGCWTPMEFGFKLGIRKRHWKTKIVTAIGKNGKTMVFQHWPCSSFNPNGLTPFCHNVGICRPWWVKNNNSRQWRVEQHSCDIYDIFDLWCTYIRYMIYLKDWETLPRTILWYKHSQGA